MALKHTDDFRVKLREAHANGQLDWEVIALAFLNQASNANAEQVWDELMGDSEPAPVREIWDIEMVGEPDYRTTFSVTGSHDGESFEWHVTLELDGRDAEIEVLNGPGEDEIPPSEIIDEVAESDAHADATAKYFD